MLVGARVRLRPVTAGDRDEFVAGARDSESLHRGLIFAPTTAAEFAEYLARFDGINAIGFVVRLTTTKVLAGFVNISHIAPAPDRHGMLGYGGFAATAGHGYVGEAVRLAVRYAFDEVGLDRLQADVQPGNGASRKVVEQAGFRSAGPTPGPICIAGQWRDHERWVITARHYRSNMFKYLGNRICQAKS